MIRTALAALVAAAVVLAPTAPTATGAETGSERAGKAITGAWKGSVYGDQGGTPGYPAKVRITKRDGKLRGKVTYPGVCAGKWRFRGEKSGWFTFREVITSGSGCVSPVNVKVRRDGKRLRVVWREPQTGDTASMRARRT